MHSLLVDHFNSNLSTMSDRMAELLLPVIDGDEVYEQLIGNTEMLHDFRNAIRWMASINERRRILVSVGVAPNYNVTINFTPTQRYKQHLLPFEPIVLPSDHWLGNLLRQQNDLAESWRKLIYVYNIFANAMPAPVISFLMPWVSILAHELQINFQGCHEVGGTNKPSEVWTRTICSKVTPSETSTLSKQLDQLCNRRVPSDYPSLSRELNAVCKSGAQLISQYNMLAATQHSKRNYSIRVEQSFNPMKFDFEREVDNIASAWRATHLSPSKMKVVNSQE